MRFRLSRWRTPLKLMAIPISLFALWQGAATLSTEAEAERAQAAPLTAASAAQVGRPPASIAQLTGEARVVQASAPVRAPGMVVNSVLAPDRPIEHGDFTWEERGVPDGPLRIVVDIAAQRLYVYRAGYEIGRAAIIYGSDEKPTPTGTFSILEKKVDHVSNLYDAPMPYMMRLTMDGIAIHASEVNPIYATHGCVGVPDEFAQLLFAAAKLGDEVLVTNGWLPHVYA